MPHSTQHQSFLLYKLILTLDIVSHQLNSYYKCFEGTEIVFEAMFKQKFRLTWDPPLPLPCVSGCIANTPLLCIHYECKPTQ